MVFRAFGAHYLKNKISDPTVIKAWETAAHYQMLHAMPLMYIGNKATLLPAGYMMTAGIICFSGSIYAMTLLPEYKKKLAIITPIGGSLLIAGWLTIAWLW